MPDTAAIQAELPAFRFHPDPVRSGSVAASQEPCVCCGSARGFLLTVEPFGEAELEGPLCPWCVADGSAHEKLDVIFNDMGLTGGVAPAIADEIEQRTPGFATFNAVEWPVCCELPMAYIEPAGIPEIRARHYTLEGLLMGVIVHQFGISGGAAHTFLESLQRDSSPTAHVFHCLSCDGSRGVIDRA